MKAGLRGADSILVIWSNPLSFGVLFKNTNKTCYLNQVVSVMKKVMLGMIFANSLICQIGNLLFLQWLWLCQDSFLISMQCIKKKVMTWKIAFFVIKIYDAYFRFKIRCLYIYAWLVLRSGYLIVLYSSYDSHQL